MTTTRNTLIFGSALVLATAAVVADHRAHQSELPAANAAKPASQAPSAQDEDENYTPCGAV